MNKRILMIFCIDMNVKCRQHIYKCNWW